MNRHAPRTVSIDSSTVTQAPSVPFNTRRRLTVNVGELTTTFTPPSSCASLIRQDFHSPNDIDGETLGTIYDWCYACECNLGTLITADACLPPVYASPYNQLALNGHLVQPVFSPGNACPAGYGSSCFMVRSDATSRPSALNSQTYGLLEWDDLGEGETAVGCCPNGFRCDSPYTCLSTPTAGNVIVAYTEEDCAATQTNSKKGTMTIATDILGMVAAAQVILILPTTPSITTTTSTTMKQPTTSTAGSSNTSDSRKNGLSTGAKAAIGVTIPLAVIAMALAAFLLLRRRRRQKSRGQEASEVNGQPGVDVVGIIPKAELESPKHRSTFSGVSRGGSELDATESNIHGHSRGASATISEFSMSSGQNRLSELPGSPDFMAQMHSAIFELPGNSTENTERPKEQQTIVAPQQPRIKRRALPQQVQKQPSPDGAVETPSDR